jgi:histidinol-phosphate aminotransferase
VGNGSDEILALCTRAFVENDGAIGYFEPSYSLYPVLADIRCVAQSAVELGAEFEWKMPRGYEASLFFMTNPNAPTSVRYPRAQVEPFCKSFGGVVLIDEAYVDFAAAHCMDLARELDNVLVARTLSKSYSLAGLRLGYAVGSPALVAALFKIKDSYNADAIAQRLALAALGDGAHMRANVARIKATRQRLSAALGTLRYRVWPSETNFLWVRPPVRPAAEVFAELRRHGILVRHFPGPRTGAFLRITIGTDEEVDKLVAALRGAAGGGTGA